jgi:hypothetical protein
MILRLKRTSVPSHAIRENVMYMDYDPGKDRVYHRDSAGNVVHSWDRWLGGERDFHDFALRRWPQYWYEIPWDEDLVMDEGL